MSKVGSLASSYWQANGVRVAPGCTTVNLDVFKTRYKVFLPEDMRDFYLYANGICHDQEQGYDHNGFRFWHLEEVKPAPEGRAGHELEWLDFPGATEFFVFADYLHWSWAYAIHLTSSSAFQNEVAIIGMKEHPIKIASCFSEFVELYVNDSSKLYGE